MKRKPITIQEVTRVQQALQNHRGSENRIAIPDLCEVLGMDRRKLREIVEFINSDYKDDFGSALILTDTDEGGYWLACESDEDLRAAARHFLSERSRGQSILNKASSIEKKGRAKWGVARFARALQEVREIEEGAMQRSLFS